jgi:SPP1 family phage portal protein
MDIVEILQLPADEQVKALKTEKNLPDFSDIEKQWQVKDHAVLDPVKRPDKKVKRSTGQKDGSGEEIMQDTTEPVNRIGVPFQRIIVGRAVGFLLGNPVKVKKTAKGESQETLAAMVGKTLKDNKEIYFNREIARTVMKECEAAELWYLVQDDTFWKKTNEKLSKSIFKLRVKLLSPGNGDKLYPYFNEFGDMAAFSREYVTTVDGKQVTNFDTWTVDKVVKRVKTDGSWAVTESANLLKKIPVVYYSQPETEWEQVQSMIERFETKISNFGDTNDYFGSPMVKVKGKVVSLPGKTSSGKVLQLATDADADYMAWNQAPESEKIEFELLEKLIYSMTHTPNISFEQMKQVGSNLSGFAIELMFTDAHLKVENKIELFGEMFQRRLNLLKHILGTVVNVSLANEVDNLELEPVFTPYLPKNRKEMVDILVSARGNKPIMSNETAVENNPLVGSVEEELNRMKADQDAELELQTREMTGTF